ncbi:protein-export chaperone SecB [Marilutibacter maris]|uniref:Protein-export protein SecB n=1 Tax=Marilutibacter maris TaxID=1605891 RepID=A0A2U9T5Y3_9GAMM|nr:protein-export chaperone SecB [Lysobacter maris]AWV05898.1 preprotein translocase subunit SecB [Lysobacter maris]KAB8193397.1 protein-export chaperone SecB [Lysobacter maris]
MSEEQNNGAAAPADAAAQNAPTFSVEKIYVKDVSFEVPGAPAVFNEQAQPQLQMNMNQNVQRLGENAFEVVLGITLTCTVGEKSIYLAEVKQAGVFGVSGFDPQTLDGLLGSHCPSILYPYARQLISDLIQAGGFPPFYLQPVNFDALYAEGLRQRQQQNGDGLADAEAAGNA